MPSLVETILGRSKGLVNRGKKPASQAVKEAEAKQVVEQAPAKPKDPKAAFKLRPLSSYLETAPATTTSSMTTEPETYEDAEVESYDAYADASEDEANFEGLGDGALGLGDALEAGDAVCLPGAPNEIVGEVTKVAWTESGSPSYYVRHADPELLEDFRHKWYADGEVAKAVNENVKSQPQVFDTAFMTNDLAGGLNAPKRQYRFAKPGDNPLAAEAQAKTHAGNPAKTTKAKPDAVQHPTKKQFMEMAERWLS